MKAKAKSIEFENFVKKSKRKSRIDAYRMRVYKHNEQLIYQKISIS